MKEIITKIQVSIILPIYNMSKYLDLCLTSLQNQTLKNIEIICVDDGSKDNSLEICNKYASQDKRFKVIHQPNQGQGAARNNGIKYAQGEYIAFVDPDDWVREDMYEILYSEAKKNNCDIAQCDYKIYSNNYVNLINLFPTKDIKTKIFQWDKCIKNGLQDFCLYCWNKIYKTELIKENKISFGSYKISEEHQFVISSMIKANKIAYIPIPLYFYLIRDNSSDHSYKINRINASEVVNTVKKELKEMGLYNKIKKAYYNYVEFVYYWAYMYISKNKIQELMDMAAKDLPKAMYKKWIKKAYRKRFLCNLNFFKKIFSICNRKNVYVKEKILTIFGHSHKFIIHKKRRKRKGTKLKKLSIITICYNEPNLITTCESIINQTWQDFEWIVIDGGSKPEILSLFNKYKNRIDKFISEPDNGINDAVNKGISLATGEYIQLLNAGDMFFNNKVLKKVFGKNKKHKDIIYGNTNNINHENWMPDFYFNPRKIDKNYFIYQNLQTPSMFVKNELFKKYGSFSFDYKIVSDRERWIVFAQNGAKFEYVDQIITSFDGSGLSSKKENFTMHNQEIEKLVNRYYSDDCIIKTYKNLKKKNIFKKIISFEKTSYKFMFKFLFFKFTLSTVRQKLIKLNDKIQALTNENAYLKNEKELEQ